MRSKASVQYSFITSAFVNFVGAVSEDAFGPTEEKLRDTLESVSKKLTVDELTVLTQAINDSDANGNPIFRENGSRA